MTHIRTCQECGHKQIANHPNTYADDSWRNLKCMACKSPALDYGSEEEIPKPVIKPEMIRHETEQFDLDSKPLHRAIAILQDYAKTYGEDATLRMCAEWDGDTKSKIVYYREETTEDRASRERTANISKETRRLIYEKLKQEFGD